MITKKRIPIGLLLMGLWIGHGFAQSKAVDPSSQIIWQDGPGSWALFIPEPLLQSENLLGLDIPNQQWQLITESWLTAKDARFKSDNDMPHCFASSESQTAILPDSEAQPLANVLRTQESVLVGAVESIWNGWGPDGPRTLIYLRVQECLKSKEPGLYFPDDLVCLSVQAGRVFIDGEVLCNETDGLVDFPVIGDSVLVSGYYFEPDPQYLGNGMVFTLKDERIMPQPYRMVSDRQPVNYSNLRVDLARDSVPQIVEALKTEGPCTVIRGGDHHLVGTVSISIPVQGLSSDLKQGIRGGMAHWNDGCNLSNIPNFAVDTATPPPTGPYDPTQVIRIQLINAEPEWNPATNNWVAATYQFGNGASTILLPQKCPKPRNGKVFPFCDQNNVFIRWSEKQGKANIAHELGHALGLGHDDCSEDSIMQPSPTRNAAISPDHCNLADSLNCPPTNSNCPTGELVPFSLNVTGWDRPDIIYVSVTVTSPNGQAPPFEITAENNGLFSGPPIRVGDSYQITNIYTTNNKKDCVASPHSGTAEANQPITVGISCTCRPPEENCDVQLSNPRLNEFPPPILDLFWGPWWGWIWGPGFGSLPCNRQTYCEDGPTHVITIDTIEIVTSELICTDLCQGKRVPIYNDLGPSVSVEFPNGNASIENEIVISGWAVDRHGVSGLAFFVDQQKVQLQNLEMGISRPESCVQAMVPNQLNCDGNTGFFGILETSKLGEGPHLLQIVAADSFPGYPMATLVEKEIIIQPGCVDHSPPSVSLVGISNGANLVIDSTTILLEADAFDEPGGSGLKEVRFFIDGVRQSTDQTAPYRYSWPATIGNHEIKLVALDHCFNSNQAIVNVTVSANPPSSVPGFAGRINGQNLNGMTVYSTQPSIHFSWAAATDPTGIGLYQLVLQPTDGSGFLYSPTTPSPNTAFDLQTSGLVPGISYSIHIRAQNNPGVWGPYVSGGVFTVAEASPPPPVPGFVGQLNGQNLNGLHTTITSPALSFSWNHPSDPFGIEKYQIVVQPTDGSGWLYQPHIDYPSTSTTIQTQNLVPGLAYSYHIRAKNLSGTWGPFVNGGSFSILQPNPPPAVPNFIGSLNGSNLNGLTTSLTNPTLQFSWSHPTDPSGIERYQVIVQPTDGSGWLYQPHILFPNSTLSLVTSGLVPGLSYSYHIRAKNNDGLWGPFATGGTFSITAPSPPTQVTNFVARINGANINGSQVGSQSPTLNFSWSHPSDPTGIERYQVVLQPTDDSGWLYQPHILYPNSSYDMVTTGLVVGQTYSYHIRAKNGAGLWGDFATGGSFTVVAPGPPPAVANFVGRFNGSNVNGANLTTTSPTLQFTWSHPFDLSGIERYQIVLQPTDGSGWLYSPHVLYPNQAYSLATTGLQVGMSYTYHIRAKNNAGLWGPFINGGQFSVVSAKREMPVNSPQ